MIRRKRLVLFDILLISLPGRYYIQFDARRVPAGGNPARSLICADSTGLSAALATKKFR
jgi:hypothetical protein